MSYGGLGGVGAVDAARQIIELQQYWSFTGGGLSFLLGRYHPFGLRVGEAALILT